MSPFSNYRMGLVMSRAGLNASQWAFLRRRLRDVARLGGAEPDGITVVVPLVVHQSGPKAEEQTRALCGELLRVPYVRLEVMMRESVGELAPALADLDEVWCATCDTADRSEYAQRPKRVHALAQKLREAARFKLLHYWTEPDPEPEPPKKKPPTMKGW